MEDAMHIMEEILETEYKGLVFIDETRKIGSYSRCAKKITGILLDGEQKHPGGRIEEGDIVIIADNELGDDDELTKETLETIGITDRNTLFHHPYFEEKPLPVPSKSALPFHQDLEVCDFSDGNS